MREYLFKVMDYTSHTAHLNIFEDIAYRRLLDLYYIQENPLPLDVKEVARLIRMSEYVDCVNTILHEFFEKTEEGWRHSECDKELFRIKRKKEKAKIAAKASVLARRAKAQAFISECQINNEQQVNKNENLASDKQPENLTSNDSGCDTVCQKLEKNEVSAECLVDAQQNNIHTPPKPSKSRKSTSTKPVMAEKPDDVPEDVWAEFLALRKARRSPLTARALEGLKREAKKAGISVTEAMTTCIERGWQGFQASWVLNLRPHKIRVNEDFSNKDYGKGICSI